MRLAHLLPSRLLIMIAGETVNVVILYHSSANGRCTVIVQEAPSTSRITQNAVKQEQAEDILADSSLFSVSHSHKHGIIHCVYRR
jgi:hypothetical protein